MAQTSFEVKGFDELSKLGERFGKEVQRKVDLASKRGINKAADLITYGRESRISPNNIKGNSAVGKAARILLIPKEHIYYRTFTRGIKVSVGRGRGAKPYASVMMRGNSINVVDLLVNGNEAKDMYGFTTRKKGIGSKKRPNMRSRAEAARVGGRRSGKVKIAGKTYNNAYIESGARRASSEAMEKHYVKKLGADPKSRLAGKRYLLLQRKEAGQKKPYPTKAVKINKRKVIAALDSAANAAVNRYSDEIVKMQTQEVFKELKKLGFTLS